MKAIKEFLMSSIQTILVPVDFSSCSHAAFNIARALAQDYWARLIVLHIAEPPPFVGVGEFERSFEQPNGYRRELEDLLRQHYSSDSPVEVKYLLAEGNPITEILAAAREERCDLIVLGTHVRTRLGHLLLGSVAEKVARKALCPVLTVKAPLRVGSRRDELAVPVQAKA
jgi:nucleotide-binding universal stress UspA family protein